MKVTIYQTISNVLNEDRSIRSSNTIEAYMLEPEAGKYLRNTRTGEIVRTQICINKESRIAEWEELDIAPIRPVGSVDQQ